MSTSIDYLPFSSSQDALVKTITKLWTSSLECHTKRMDALDEVRRYLGITDTTALNEPGLNWKNRTDIPILYWISINLKSQYLNAIFPREDWFAWRASNNTGSKLKAKLFQEFLKVKLQKIEFIKHFTEGIKNTVNFGDTLFLIEETRDPETGEVIPKMKVVPLNSWFVDPTAASVESSWLVIKSWKSVPDILEDVTLDLLDKTKFKTFLTSDKTQDYSDVLKSRQLLDDGFSQTALKDKTHVELLDFYGDLYNPLTGKIEKTRRITIVNRMFLGRNIQQERNVVHMSYEKKDNSPYSFGALEKLVGMQYMINKLENVAADIKDFTVHPVQILYGNVPSSKLNYGPNAQWRMGSECKVQIITPPDNSESNYVRIDKYIALMQKISGAREENVGIRSKGEKTAFEVDLLQQGSNILHNTFVQSFERSAEKLLNIFFKSFIKGFMGMSFDIPDEITGAITRVVLTPEDLKETGHYRALGSTELLQRNELIRRLMTIMELREKIPLVRMHTSGYQTMKELEKAYDLEHTDIFGKYKGLEEESANSIFVSVEQEKTNKLQEQLRNLGLTGAPESPAPVQGQVPQGG